MSVQDPSTDHGLYGLAFPDPSTSERRPTAFGFLLDSVRRRPAGRTLLSGLTTLLFLAGAGMFMYPLFTDVYTNQVVQQRLQDELLQIQVDVTSQDEYVQTTAGQTGRPVTTINIPAINLEMIVVEGTSPDALRAGAGHYPNTPLPGQPGNVAIAGHRTTYGRPFNRLDEMDDGDVIWMSTPVGDHRYEVSRVPAWNYTDNSTGAFITGPRDWTVIAPPGTAGQGGQAGDFWLTLTTCHPKGSAAQRLVVRAQLTESFPAGTYEQRKADGELEL